MLKFLVGDGMPGTYFALDKIQLFYVFLQFCIKNTCYYYPDLKSVVDLGRLSYLYLKNISTLYCFPHLEAWCFFDR